MAASVQPTNPTALDEFALIGLRASCPALRYESQLARTRDGQHRARCRAERRLQARQIRVPARLRPNRCLASEMSRGRPSQWSAQAGGPEKRTRVGCSDLEKACAGRSSVIEFPVRLPTARQVAGPWILVFTRQEE